MPNKENAKQQIKGLLEKYQKVVEEKRVSKYKEEETKKDFILPLFRALGWNVENSLEVTAEEKISKKRVDYGFRINGIPKFFLEAKALKADLRLLITPGRKDVLGRFSRTSRKRRSSTPNGKLKTFCKTF